MEFVRPLAETSLVQQLGAVVRQDHDHGLIEEVQVRHRVQQPAHVLVHEGDLPEIKGLDAPEFRLRWSDWPAWPAWGA